MRNFSGPLFSLSRRGTSIPVPRVAVPVVKGARGVTARGAVSRVIRKAAGVNPVSTLSGYGIGLGGLGAVATITTRNRGVQSVEYTGGDNVMVRFFAKSGVTPAYPVSLTDIKNNSYSNKPPFYYRNQNLPDDGHQQLGIKGLRYVYIPEFLTAVEKALKDHMASAAAPASTQKVMQANAGTIVKTPAVNDDALIEKAKSEMFQATKAAISNQQSNQTREQTAISSAVGGMMDEGMDASTANRAIAQLVNTSNSALTTKGNQLLTALNTTLTAIANKYHQQSAGDIGSRLVAMRDKYMGDAMSEMAALYVDAPTYSPTVQAQPVGAPIPMDTAPQAAAPGGGGGAGTASYVFSAEDLFSPNEQVSPVTGSNYGVIDASALTDDYSAQAMTAEPVPAPGGRNLLVPLAALAAFFMFR